MDTPTTNNLILHLDTVELRVSPKLLKMASSVFRAMLSDTFREGRELRTTSHLRLPLPEDYPDAVPILSNMIHGHAYRHSPDLAFGTLADIAVLVDKYLLHEMAGSTADPGSRRPECRLRGYHQCQTFCING